MGETVNGSCFTELIWKVSTQSTATDLTGASVEKVVGAFGYRLVYRKLNKPIRTIRNLYYPKGKARVASWWEHSPPTSMARVRILPSTPYVGWVCCWLSPLFREVFLRALRFSPLLKNQHFQIPIRSGTHGHISTSSHELLSALWVNKLQFTIYNFYYMATIVRALWLAVFL